MDRTPGSGTSVSRDIGQVLRRFGRATMPDPVPEPAPEGRSDDPLGTPLDIRQTAELIGCSVWTVRQKLVARGLPHFRSGPSSKLIFYRNQVIDWLLRQQKQGGLNP